MLQNFEMNDLSKKINENIHDSKKMFKIIDETLHRKLNTPFPECNSDFELTNTFNNYFNEKIVNIRKKLDENSTGFIEEHSFKGKPLREFKLLSQEEVRILVMKSKNSYNDILDPLPTFLVKECLNELLPLITDIINTSLKFGIVSEPLKHAMIKPLLKKLGLELIEKNYRPVSNLSFISKLIERAVLEQYVDHLKSNNLEDPKQSAYKKFHSTETLLLKMKDNIQLHIDNGEVVLLVLLDLLVAFDTIDHEILINRLEKMYGIEHNCLEWFKSYLKDRTQAVNIYSAISKESTLKQGVPQRSIHGPVLFNSYIAPLSDIAKRYKIDDEKFADDNQMAIAFKTQNIHTQINAVVKIEKSLMRLETF